MKRKQKVVISVCSAISLTSYLQSCKTTENESAVKDDEFGDEKGGYVRPTAEALEAAAYLKDWIRSSRLTRYVGRITSDRDTVVIDFVDHRGAHTVQQHMQGDDQRFYLSQGKWVFDLTEDRDDDDKGGFGLKDGDNKGGDGKGGDDKGGYQDDGDDDNGNDKGGDDKGGYQDDDKGGNDKGGSGKGGDISNPNDGKVEVRLTVNGISFNPGENSKGGADPKGGNDKGGYQDDDNDGYGNDKGGNDKGGGGKGGN